MRSSDKPALAATSILSWYLEHVYGVSEGPGCVPFFADPMRLGWFATDLEALRARDEEALFKLFVTMSLFQARRDVLMMARLKSYSRSEAAELSSRRRLGLLLEASKCPHVSAETLFERACDVRLSANTMTCSKPTLECHVRRASTLLRRMADMGKLPTSAFLHIGRHGFAALVDEARSSTNDPTLRARFLIARLTAVHRVGRKLATMYVTALSTPEISPGFAPWYPDVDGGACAVVDTNVARVITQITGRTRTYRQHEGWISRAAARLTTHDERVARVSPRLLQQALYAFGSRSNRVANQDPCSTTRCQRCPSTACPFVANA